jgi:SagB-type dehydrogenase family enzyme
VTTPLSAREIDYPAIVAAHDASMLRDPAEVASWRTAAASAPAEQMTADAATTMALPPPAAPSGGSIDEVIGSRGSTRAFAYRALSIDQLSTLLAAATAAVPGDAVPPGAHLADPYVIVHAVEGVAAGAYAYDRERHTLALIRSGDFRERAGFLSLGQELPADASVNVYLLSDLDAVLARLGNRGYRAAQLDAAIAGGKLYLAAYALGLGATGLTFFDDEVTEFFSPHAAGKSVMFLVAIGLPRKRRARAPS